MTKETEIPLDFSMAKEKLLSFLENKDNAVMVLATSANNVVMARPVLIFNHALDIYFFTWKHSRKCAQIENNNQVALCKEKVEIEGMAEEIGLMTSEKNRKILEVLRKKRPEAIKRWENKPNMVIIRIKPRFACIDGYFIEDDAYLEYIDFEGKHAYKVKWGYY